MMNFGPNDANSLPSMLARHMAPGMIPGPVPQQQLTPGFRPPGAGGGAPGMQQQQPQVPGMDPNMLAMMAMAMRRQPGTNEQQVGKTLDAAPAAGSSDPMAQGAAQTADMQGGWLQRAFKGLF